MRLFSVYFGASIIASLIPFILLPIITSYLALEKYGIWALFLMLVSIVSPALTIGGQHHINRTFFKEEKTVLANHLYNLGFQSFALFVVLMMVALVIWQTTDTFLSIPSGYILLVPLAGFLQVLLRVVRGLLKFERKTLLFAFQTIAMPLLANLIALGCLVMSELGWLSMVLGYILASLILAVISAHYLLTQNWLKPPFSWRVTKSMLLVNAPVVPYLLLQTLQGAVDRIMLETLMTTEQVGIYSIAFALGTVGVLFMGTFAKVWQPWVYEQLNHPDVSKRNAVVKYSYLYYAAMIVMALGIAVGGYLYITWFFVETYHPAVSVVVWLAMTSVPVAISQNSMVFLNHEKQTWFWPLISLSSIILNLGLNYVLIPLNGIDGAAQATLLATTVQAGLIFFLAQRYCALPWFRSFQKN